MSWFVLAWAVYLLASAYCSLLVFRRLSLDVPELGLPILQRGECFRLGRDLISYSSKSNLLILVWGLSGVKGEEIKSGLV